MQDNEEIDEPELPEEDDVAVVGDDDENPDLIEDKPVRFDISSYGWDVDVDGLVKRMNRQGIYVPGFQRGFVWSKSDKSQFVESLILGLPVPTLFLARDSETENRLNIIDGQQRLRTLQSYLNGEFALSGRDISGDLRGLFHSSRRAEFGDRKAYPKAKILSPADERTLEDAVVHSIVIRPNPRDDDENLGREYNRAIIQIFKRLNTTGKALQPQEVRASIFYGTLLDLIQDLNLDEHWRALFGPVHGRMKDQEAITRALALFVDGEIYTAPMPRFLDNFMENHRNMDQAHLTGLRDRFLFAVKLIRSTFGDAALKRGNAFWLTRLDALVVGIMEALRNDNEVSAPEFEASFIERLGERTVECRLNELESDNRGIDESGEEIDGLNTEARGYNWSTAKFTNDTNRVQARLAAAKAVFAR